MMNILDTGSIKGGDYSVPGERAFGAQWGADQGAVAQWGERQRGKRLGHELFMAEINGKGRVFAHLSGADGKLQPDSGEVSLDPSFCATGLGCSVHINIKDVVNWYAVENGTPKRTTLNKLIDLSGSLGQKPRDLDLFKGAWLYNLPSQMQKALRYEVYLGQSSGLKMDRDRIGRLVISTMCREGVCEDWGTSITRANSQASPSNADGENSFAVVVALTAHVAAPYHEVSLAGQSAKIKYVEVGVPGKRGLGAWHRIWQPWGKATVHFLDNGRVAFR
jgi:hypothetical protein